MQVKWSENTLSLSALYGIHIVSAPLALGSLSVKMLSFGGSKDQKLIACVKGKSIKHLSVIEQNI